MRKTFWLKAKPFSVNAMFYGDARTKTTECREWSYQILHQLSSPAIQPILDEIREHFDIEKHVISVSLVAYFPRKTWRTKEGGISARTMDLSNWEKPLIDLIFDKQYFERVPPYGCRNLNINDKYITSLYSQKKPTDEENPSIQVTIKVFAIPQGLL